MTPTFRNRIKQFICKWFGHNNKYSHDFGGYHHYVCKRCGVLNSKSINEEKKEENKCPKNI